ncbi:MAG: hypothetical protein IJH13_00805 [Bacilli bacterium]|nr:hypothetical protein [Bacilli bacterium]
MKKMFLSILISALLIVGLTGCSVFDLVKKAIDPVEKAEILNWKSVHSKVFVNEAKAEDYEGKWYLYMGEVYSINKDHCQLGSLTPIDVYLDKEVLKGLNKGDKIVVVGKLEDMISNPKLTDALMLDSKTVKEKLVLAKTKTTGLSRNIFYSDYKVDSKTHNITSFKTSGTSNATHKMKYNSKNNLEEEIVEYSIASYGIERINYTYNKDDKIKTERFRKIKDGKTTEDNTWHYSYKKTSKGKTLEKTTINYKTNYKMTYIYEYDKDDNITKETQSSPNGTYTIEYEYDEFGNRIKEVSYNVLKPYYKATTTYEYTIVAKK